MTYVIHSLNGLNFQIIVIKLKPLKLPVFTQLYAVRAWLSCGGWRPVKGRYN